MATEGLSLVLLFAAFGLMQALVGGTRMAFSLPVYGLVGVAGVIGFFSWRRIKPSPSQFCLGSTVAFLGYALGRALLSPVPYIARSDVYSILGGLAVYFLVACILVSARQRMVLLLLLLAFALIHVAVGAIQFRDGNNFMPISWLQRYDYEWRASGLYVCPNHLAGLLEVLGVMGLSLACWSRWPVWSKLFISYGVGVCYVGLILTASRGGYLSAGASLFVFALLSLVTLRRLGAGLAWKIGLPVTIVAVLLAMAAVFYVSKNAPLRDRAQTTFDASNIRIDLWKAALEQWKLQPVIGTGSATYLYYGRFFRTPQMQLDPVYTHGDYLQLLAEYGLVGVLGLAIFLFAHLRHGFRSFSRLGPRRVAASQLLPSNALALNIGAIAAVSSILVHSIFDFNMHIPANVLLMAFVFAVLANEGVAWERQGTSVALGQLLWRLVLPVLSLALVVQCFRLLPGEYFSERARMAVRDDQPGLALLYARRGLKYDPANPDLHARLGTARLQFADRAETPEAAGAFRDAAIASLQRARSLAPREESYGLELAGVLDAAGHFDEAETIFQELLRDDPKSQNLRRYHEGHLKIRRPEETNVAPAGS
ncbi:MAG: O-antigen ligase family protein [Chthoniobacterales bacterium]